jgi:hypothetical protein
MHIDLDSETRRCQKSMAGSKVEMFDSVVVP